MFAGSAHRRDFQRGFDTDRSRRERLNHTLSLRKKVRQERLHKRRRELKPRHNGEDSKDSTNIENVSQSRLSVATYLNQLKNWKLATHNKALEALRMLRQDLSCERNPPIGEVIKTGVVPILIEYLVLDASRCPQKANAIEEAQFEASWALTNITSGESVFCGAVVQMGLIPATIQLISRNPSDRIVSQCIWCMGNVAGDRPEFKLMLLQAGLMEYILKKYHEWNEETQKNGLWTVSNLCRRHYPFDKNHHQFMWEKQKHAVPLLLEIFNENDELDKLTDCLWCLQYLSDDQHSESNQVDFIVEHNVVPLVVELLSDETKKYYFECKELQRRGEQSIKEKAYAAMSQRIFSPCLRILGNIASGSDSAVQALLDETKFWTAIVPFFTCPWKETRRSTFWMLSNIMAGTAEQLARVSMNHALLDLIRTGCRDEWIVAKEAFWCVSNGISTGSEDVIRRMVDETDAIEAIVRFLGCRKPRELRAALETMQVLLQSFQHRPGDLNYILEQMEMKKGLDKLEELQSDENLSDKFYEMASKIVTTYWGDDNQLSSMAPNAPENDMYSSNPFAPKVQGQTFVFGFDTSSGTPKNNDVASSSNANTWSF